MSVEIDTLEVEVRTSAKQASSGISDLTSSLERLKTVAKGGAGLTAVSKQLQALTSSTQGAVSASQKVSNLASALSKLQGIQKSSGMNSVANALKKINEINLSNISVDKMQSLTTALNELGSVQKSDGLNSAVNALRKIPDIIDSLDDSKLSRFATQMNKVAASIRPLATEMQKVSNGFSAFPIRIQKIISSNAGLTASNTKAAKSFSLFSNNITGTLANITLFGYTIDKIADVVSDWVKSANDYVENINLFQVSMGEFYGEAYEYSQLVNDKLGIDPSEWMRNQGVFMSMANGFGLARDQAYALSEGLTELSYDLSSLYNEDVEQSALRLQSALSGEIEPIRRLGISISQATLQEYALEQGINENIEAMTEQEKAILRTLVLMEGAGRIGAIGDFAKTLESPANSLRVLNQQITQLGRALGQVLVPILIQVIPYIQAFVEIVTEAIQKFATLVGFTMPNWNDDITSGADDTTDSMEDATEATKELKNALLGIDELNILSPNSKSSSGNDSGWVSDIEIPNIWDQEVIENLRSKVDVLKEPLKDLLENYIIPIGVGLAAWKISSSLIPELGRLTNILGGILVTTGIALLVDSITDIIFGDGLTWGNILEGGAGGALAGAGLGYMLARHLGLTWSQGMLSGAILGLGLSLLVMSIISQIKDGLNIGNVLLGVVGGAISGAALGAGLAFKLGKNVSQGAIGGLVAGIGLSLVISSVISILDDGLNIKNGLLGLIGGALSGAGIGFSIGGLSGAAIGAVIGIGLTLSIEGIFSQISDGANPANTFMSTLGNMLTGGGLGFIAGKATGGLVGIIVGAALTFAFQGINSQIENGANILDGIKTVLSTALAGAGIGFMVGGPAGAGVGAAIGLVAGVVLEITGITAAGEAAYQATEDFQVMENILDRCAEASERTSAAFDTLKNGVENLNTIAADYGVASRLVDEIYAINENANASAYELQLMAVKVETLNSLNIDGLSLSIDETTGRVIESKAAVEELISSLQKQAQMEAMYDLLVQTYKDQYQALSDMTQAAKDYDAANEALKQSQSELNDTGLLELSRRSELKAAIKEQTAAMESAQGAYDETFSLYKELDDTINTYTGMLTDMKMAESGVGNGVKDGLASAESTLNEFKTANFSIQEWEAIGENIASGIASGISKNSGIVEEAINNLGSGTSVRVAGSFSGRSGGRNTTVSAYANGGFPTVGQLFLAREAGAELVGTIGGRTAVANNDQIVSGIAEANNGVINAVMAMGQAIVKAINDQETSVQLDGKVVSRTLYSYNQQVSREKGSRLVTGGVAR